MIWCNRLAVISLWSALLLLIGCNSPRHGPGKPDHVVNSSGAAPREPKPGNVAAHAHFGTAIVHEMNGEIDQAVEEYAKAARKNPEDEWLVLEVSRRLLQHKKLEIALNILQRAAESPKASSSLFARLAMVHSQRGDTSEAEQAAKIAIRKNPGGLEGYHTLFVVYLQSGKLEEALRMLNAASRQNKASGEFLVGLGELYMNLTLQAPSLRTNATAQALQLLRRAEPLVPTNSALRLKMADGFSVLGDTGKASEIYLETLKSAPETAIVREHVHGKLAEIYLRASDKTNALQHLEGIVRSNPTNPQAWYFLGALALEGNQPERAIEHFSRCMALSPDFEPAYYDLASAQLSAEKARDALETLGKARRKFTQNFLLELLTGLAYTQEKEYTNAVRNFAAAEVIAAATDPKRLNHVFYFQTGAALERSGDLEAAERYMQMALEQSPNFSEALNYLGYMWAEQGVHLDKAKEMLERAVGAEPKNAAFLDSLGWVYFKLKDYRRALEKVLKAVELSEEPDAVLYDHLGDIYRALGQEKEAREAYQRSLKIEDKESVRKKLE